METFYSLFNVTRELLTCRAIFRYSKKHDHTLEVGKEEIITFALPDNLNEREQNDICLGFNPEMVDIKAACILPNPDQDPTHTNLTITLVARDIGSTKIGITTPYKAATHSLKTYLLTTAPKPQLA